MAVRPVVRYPDDRLKAVCQPVLAGSLDDAAIAALAQDLLDTMDHHPGCVGVAAPQIGALVRMCAIDVSGHPKTRSCHGRLVLIDPVIEEEQGKVRMREGCLSIPDFTGNVVRPKRVTIAATSPAGEALRLECDAYEARVALHELDHLDGMLFLDRVISARDVFPRRRYS